MVLIRFRSSQNKSYKIELEPTSTISQAKESLSREIGNNADHSKFKMLYKAKMLKDDQTIESLHLSANDFIFVHAFLPKPIINYNPNIYPVKSEEAARIVKEVTSIQSTIPPNSFTRSMAENPDNHLDRIFGRVIEIEPLAIENVIQIYQMNNLIPNDRDHLPELFTRLGLNPESYDLESLRNRRGPRLSQADFNTIMNRVCAESGGEFIPYRRNAPQRRSGNRIMFGFNDFIRRRRQQQGQVNPILAQFTPEEREAIQRLQQLGNFTLEYVVQMYIAADKNENNAANLLLGN